MSSPSCPICYSEADATTSSINLLPLRQCSHRVCRSCLVQWIETVEASGNTARPWCPFCNTPLTREETQSILGRPYTPATKRPVTEQEMDEFTRHLLEETCKPCPHCGAWIEKTGGCGKMECLCGYQFCYSCGAQGAECDCTPENHRFWDNIRDDSSILTVQPAQRDEKGQVNLGWRIRQVMVSEQRCQQQWSLQSELETMHPLISGAFWLFASNCRDATLKMLSLHTEMAMRHEEEDDVDQFMTQQCPVCAAWTANLPLSNGQFQIFGTIADVYPRSLRVPKIEGDVCRCSCGTRFCFPCGMVNPMTCRHGKHPCSDPSMTRCFAVPSISCDSCAINHELELQALAIYESSAVQNRLCKVSSKSRKQNKSKMCNNSTQSIRKHAKRPKAQRARNRAKRQKSRRARNRKNYEFSHMEEGT